MYRFYKEIVFLFLLVGSLLQLCYGQKITSSVQISSGAVNGVLIERNGRKLALYGDPENEWKDVDKVLFTHSRRDVIWAGRKLVSNGSEAIIPQGERSCFDKGDSLWSRFLQNRFHDYNNQTTKVGILPIQISREVKGGDVIRWQDISFKVLNTPGYSKGAVSYLADIDQKRYVFTGDLIYGDGRILDLYSFQDSLGSVLAYHGYAARLRELLLSLQLIADQKPDILIPARGAVIRDPAASIGRLMQRIRLVYQNYLAISAYRWYNPQGMEELAKAITGPDYPVEKMPLAMIEKKPPSWYVHTVNSNLVFSKDSSAFLIDCGLKGSYENILKLKQNGRLKSLEGIFITHYHDDHLNFINDLVKEFRCPVYITKELKDILENPSAYHMPCLATDPVPNTVIMKEGQTMKWKEFSLTFHYFPGQTLYHDAVLFERDNGESIFFIGDSFTPSGIDDYCLLNRNLIHPGTGYFYCLDFLKKLPSKTLLANQHVDFPFIFSQKQLEFMTNTLLKRNSLLKELFPWDDTNYGLDEQWISIHPYGQKARPGQTLEYTVRIFNHSPKSKTFTLGPNVPNGCSVVPNSTKLIIAPQTEKKMIFKVKLPEKVSSGVALFTVNVKFDQWDLREWSEALMEIK